MGVKCIETEARWCKPYPTQLGGGVRELQGEHASPSTLMRVDVSDRAILWGSLFNGWVALRISGIEVLCEAKERYFGALFAFRCSVRRQGGGFG
jgi:hypothetical protein